MLLLLPLPLLLPRCTGRTNLVRRLRATVDNARFTVKLNAPMRAEPSPNATARLEFKLHQVVLTGKNMRPVHHTPIEALGLEMDDDAPGDEDEHLELQDDERHELRVGA